MKILNMPFDRSQYEVFRGKQWEKHLGWDGKTFSLDPYGNLFITARVGGQRVPRYPVGEPDIFADLERVRRIYHRKRPSGGRFKIDEGGARQVDSGRDLPHFIEFQDC